MEDCFVLGGFFGLFWICFVLFYCRTSEVLGFVLTVKLKHSANMSLCKRRKFSYSVLMVTY